MKQNPKLSFRTASRYWLGIVVGAAPLLGQPLWTAHADPLRRAGAQLAPVANPFKTGTEKAHLSPEKIKSLQAYVNQSKVRLEQALVDGKDRDVAEKARIYLDAVKSVVIDSAADPDHARSELLMRIILNQTLALTYGVPTADGKGIETPGVLADSNYADLLPTILQESIQTALAYAAKDLEAIEKGALIDLPYPEVALLRLTQAERWMRSVLEQSRSASFGLSVLDQWLSTMMQEDDLHQAKHASVITLAIQAQHQAASIAQTHADQPSIAQGQQARLARITMKKIIGKNIAEPHVTKKPVGDQIPFGIPGAKGMNFVRINPGTFLMGSPSSEQGRRSNETQHSVTLTQAYEIQTTAVTQAQYVQLMGNNPSSFAFKNYCPGSFTQVRGVDVCPNHPVENVSWDDAQRFISRFNEVRASIGYHYRLPTEAEWECAARAGSQTAYSYGSDPGQLGLYDWFNGNSGKQTHAVASLKPNSWGLYDMHGNVCQWVQDLYGDYPSASVTDPQGPAEGSYRGIRGGSWYDLAGGVRSANRDYGSPGLRLRGLGFRLVRTR